MTSVMDIDALGFVTGTGLTHLGIVSAVGTASKGFPVLGYDARSYGH